MKLVTLEGLKQFKHLLLASLNDSSGENGSGNVSETIEITYEYDGDNVSDENTWITNYGGTKVFVKMGEIPEGTINLVGSTIFRTNPNNQWLDRTFTITEEHLTKVLNKANTDIPATQDGLIQIYDIMASDFSEFTVLCVCTKAGWYNVVFDDWYEIINFPETGIYAYDKRTYGGNDYLKSFTFSVTSSSNSDNDQSSDSTSTTNPVKYLGNEITMFSRGICIGDSVTEGSFDNAQGGAIIKKYAYPTILKRLSNIDIVNAGIAGMTSQTWYEASLNSDDQWGKWLNNEWVWNMYPTNSGNDIISSILDYSGFDFAIIHLGINDLASVYDDTKTIDEVLINFETYMNNIINKLKAANKGIKIFLATIIPSYANPTNVVYGQLNDKIKAIVEYTDDAYLLDLNSYSECASHEAYNVTHPTAIGYQKLASEIYSMISYIIKNNLNEFKSVQFIGSDYTI
jgi:lysophospholipase L1-like esterase